MALIPDARNRTAVDLAILGITVTVCAVLLLTLIAIILIELIHPETNTDVLIEAESEILGVLVGAVVGFIGGRGYQLSQRNEVPSE